MRYKTASNGQGGWNVRDTRTGRDVGTTISHRRNAEIKAQRLNGGEAEWLRFYGVTA